MTPHPNRRRRAMVATLWLLVATGLLGCKKFDPPASGGAPGANPETPATPPVGGDPPGDAPTGGGGGSVPPPTTPPQPATGLLTFQLGQAGKDMVFVPDPEHGRVAIIAATSLDVTHASLGERPSLVAAHPDHNRGVALDPVRQRAYVLDGERPDRAPTSVPVQAGANALAVSADGDHALVYFDDTYALADPGANSTEAIQRTTGTLVTLEDEPTSHAFEIGQAPQRVVFADDADLCFVFGERGISRLALSELRAGRATETTPIDFDELADAMVGQVALASNGDGALLTLADEGTFLWVDLADEQLHERMVSDLDAVEDALHGDDLDAGLPEDFPIGGLAVSDDGRHGLLVLPEQELLVSMRLPEVFEDPAAARAFPLVVSSQASLHFGAGDLAVVLDNEPDAPRVTTLRVADDGASPRTRKLNAPASMPVFADDLAAFVLLHDDPAFVGYSLVVPPAAPRARATRVIPSALGLSSESVWALVLDPDAAYPRLEQLEFGAQTADAMALPAFARTLDQSPGARSAVVFHEHRDGRITTIGWETLEPHTLTGFHLRDRVRE